MVDALFPRSGLKISSLSTVIWHVASVVGGVCVYTHEDDAQDLDASYSLDCRLNVINLKRKLI